MSTPQQKFRLLRVEIEGFRAINSRVQLDPGERATLLLAPNGQGKTSLLAAIEWCLFGKLAYQISENLTNDEVVSELTLVDGQRLAATILAELADVYSKRGLREPDIAEPRTVDDLERVARKVKEAIRECRLSTAADPSAAAVSRKLGEVEAVKLKIESAALTRTRAAEQLGSHEQAHGSDEAMARLKSDLESKRSEVHAAIAALDATTRLLGDAIEVIRTDPTMTACPVCGQQVRASSVIESLDTRLRGVQRTEHDRRVAELNQISRDLDALGRVRGALEK